VDLHRSDIPFTLEERSLKNASSLLNMDMGWTPDGSIHKDDFLKLDFPNSTGLRDFITKNNTRKIREFTRELFIYLVNTQNLGHTVRNLNDLRMILSENKYSPVLNAVFLEALDIATQKMEGTLTRDVFQELGITGTEPLTEEENTRFVQILETKYTPEYFASLVNQNL
jgi:hypothetical protein